MPDPNLLQQQRHRLRSFRKGGAQRVRAEFISEANYNAERQAADQALASARVEAEAALAKTDTNAQVRRKTEQASADAELTKVRQAGDRHMAEVHKAQEQAKEALVEANLGSLVQDVSAVQPNVNANRHADQELAGVVDEATHIATKLIPGLVRALTEDQERIRHRQEMIGITILGVAITVAIIGLALYGSWQDNQQTRRYQATATAQTVIAQTTATAQAAIVQATATAEAAPAAATATAVAPLLGILEEQTGMKMAYVAAGDFTMGSPWNEGKDDEHPQHTASLDAFWIDKTEVTAAQYRKCVDAEACSAADISRQCTYADETKSSHPINCVDWNQAVAFCEWAGKRLPTEAEWEKAARGVDARLYPWGNHAPDTALANFASATRGTTQVGRFPAGASPYDALDMAGNVSEWVMDWYDESYYSESTRLNPAGPASGETRVLRGGAWTDGESDVRVTDRISREPGYRGASRGFRCAYSP